MDGLPHFELFRESLLFFITTMIEMGVLFIGISFLVGVLNEFLPKEKVKSWLSGKKGRGYLLASLLGGVTPFCSCSTIPFTIGLLRAQAGFGPTMTFLFTSPLVNPIIIPLFLTLIGFEATLVYASIALGLSITIGFLLDKSDFHRFLKKEAFTPSFGLASTHSETPSKSTGSCCEAPQQHPKPAQLQPVTQCISTTSDTAIPLQSLPMATIQAVSGNRWQRIFTDAVNQFRKLLPFILIGVGIGSVIHGFIPADLVVAAAGKDNPLAVPVSAVIGIPLYLRVSTMVPIAASLIAKGMSTGAVIALIIGGAGASLPEMAMLRGIFKTPLLAAFIAAVMVMAVTAGLAINIL